MCLWSFLRSWTGLDASQFIFSALLWFLMSHEESLLRMPKVWRVEPSVACHMWCPMGHVGSQKMNNAVLEGRGGGLNSFHALLICLADGFPLAHVIKVLKWHPAMVVSICCCWVTGVSELWHSNGDSAGHICHMLCYGALPQFAESHV